MRHLGWPTRSNHWLLALGLVFAVTSTVVAQAPPTPTSVPVVPMATPAAPTGFLGKCSSCVSSIGGCFKGCCNTPLGRLLNGAVKPLELATGGVISAPCPDPDEPSKHSDGSGGGQSGGAPGPQQAAEAIKQDQAQAKARCEAVRYLATVPCHYYPEAEAGLILALRADRSECVRWEAAHALAQGCCCTKKTIEALKIVVSGSQKDGNPCEQSIRVKVEALNALEHCLAMCGDAGQPQRPEYPAHIPEPEPVPTPQPLPQRPEVPLSQDAQSETGVQQVNYYEEVERQSTAALLADARRLVESSRQSAGGATAMRRGRSLAELWRRSDRSDEQESEAIADTTGSVRVELPAAEQEMRQPTLAPPSPPAAQADLATGYTPTMTPSLADHPYTNAPAYDPAPSQSAGGYGVPEQPLRDETLSTWTPLPPPYTTPPGYGQWPTASRPQSPRPTPSIQALPPANPATRTTPQSPIPGTPGQISTAIGQQGYLYPSTETPLDNSWPQTRIAQQPDWGNSTLR